MQVRVLWHQPSGLVGIRTLARILCSRTRPFKVLNMIPKPTTFIFPANALNNPNKFHLTPVDYVMPQVYTRTVRCYRYPPSSSAAQPFEDIVDLLRKSLSSILSEYPILAGRLCVEPPTGKPWIRPATESSANNPHPSGVRFVVNDLVDSAFPSFPDLERQNFPISLLPGDVLSPVESFPVKLSEHPESGAEPLVVQTNPIRNGIIITVCTHHSICDGTGHASFIHRWAELSRKILQSPGELFSKYNPSIHDRSPLMPNHESWITVPQQEHRAYNVVEAVKMAPSQGFKPPPPPLRWKASSSTSSPRTYNF